MYIILFFFPYNFLKSSLKCFTESKTPNPSQKVHFKHDEPDVVDPRRFCWYHRTPVVALCCRCCTVRVVLFFVVDCMTLMLILNCRSQRQCLYSVLGARCSVLGARCSVLGDWCQQIQQKLYSASAYNKTSIANACRQPCAIPR